MFRDLLDSIIDYIKDIPWLLFDRKPKWNDVEECDRLWCSYCGKPFDRK